MSVDDVLAVLTRYRSKPNRQTHSVDRAVHAPVKTVNSVHCPVIGILVPGAGRSTVQKLHCFPVGGFQDGHRGLTVTVWHGSSLSGRTVDCQSVSDEGRRQLRSVTSRTCVVRRTYSKYGERCFATATAGQKL